MGENPDGAAGEKTSGTASRAGFKITWAYDIEQCTDDSMHCLAFLRALQADYGTNVVGYCGLFLEIANIGRKRCTYRFWQRFA